MCFETNAKPAASTSFKKGDLVKILRIPTKEDKKGWDNSWTPDMDSAVGQVGTVLYDYDEIGVRIKVASIPRHDYFYPNSILQLTTVPALVASTNPKDLVADINLAAKFPVGSKVRAYFTDYGSANEGKIATVLPTENIGYVYVEFKDSKNRVNLFPQRLTLIEVPAQITETPSTETIKKARGIAGAVKSHSAVFVKALFIAKSLGRSNPFVNADMVQDKLAEFGYSSTELGNAAGALFRGKSWKKVGYKKSARLGNHAREITNWTYIGQ